MTRNFTQNLNLIFTGVVIMLYFNSIMKVMKNYSKKLLDKTKEFSSHYDINKLYIAYYKDHHSIEYKTQNETVSTEPGSDYKSVALSEEFILNTQLWPNQPIHGLIIRVGDNKDKLAFIRPAFPKRKNNHHLLINIFDRPDQLVKGEKYSEFQFNRTLQSVEFYVHLNSDSEYVYNEVLRNHTVWNIADNPDKLITVSDESTVVNFKYKDRYVREKEGHNSLKGFKLSKSDILSLEKLWDDLEFYLKNHLGVNFQKESDIEFLLLSKTDDIEDPSSSNDDNDEYLSLWNDEIYHEEPIEALFIPDNEGHCIIIIPTKECGEPVTSYYVIAQPFDGINPNYFANTDFNYIHFRFDYLKERNYTALNFLQKAIQGDLVNEHRTFDQWFREDQMNYDVIQKELSQ